MRRPLLLRIPGLRRYGDEIARLRRQIADLERPIAPPEAEISDELLSTARRYDYYWYNADKKIDLRTIDIFGPIASQIRRKNRIFLHVDRLYTLWQGVVSLPEDATAVAEVGAYRGGSARFVAEAMRATNRELPFYVCDTFRGHVEVDDAVDGLHAIGAQFTKTDAAAVAYYLRRFTAVQIIEGDIRETTARIKNEHRFGLMHIDVDVYPITKYCLEFFAPRTVRAARLWSTTTGRRRVQARRRRPMSLWPQISGTVCYTC